MTTFISPKPHEKATWHAAVRRAFAAVQADIDAEALRAFDARQDARDLKATAKAVSAGHTHSACSRCGNTRTLSWAGGHCNEWADNDEQMCGGTYRAAGGC